MCDLVTLLSDHSDLLFFLDDTYQTYMDALAAEIAYEVEWYLEYNCSG